MTDPDIGTIGPICMPDAHGRCSTCADEALPAQVLQIDQAAGLALVRMGPDEREIDISLIDLVEAGDIILVHGGVALANLGEQ